MNFLGRLLLGDGRLTPAMKDALTAEGLVLLEEGLGGSVRYKRFRAPGKYFHGKIALERIGLGVSEKRVVAYCRSGRVKLIDSEFASPRLDALDVSVKDEGRVAFHVDYGRLDQADAAGVSGAITIVARTPNAERVVEHVTARIRRAHARH